VSNSQVEPGTLLAGRYEIEDLLSEEGNSRSWRARDQVLARSVVIQVIPGDAPTAVPLLNAAKHSSRVADTRFLHVLDAATEDGITYVVREWVRGQSLDVILNEGPLPARRAAWIVREVAAAIAAAHREGVTHGCLEPDTIVITSSGGIKILGLGTLAALAGAEVDDPERRDTRELGRLLYACLTARWPGRQVNGLVPAPTEHGRLLRPRQVRAGVPRPLDEVADRILGNPPRYGTPLISADDVEESLTRVLAGDPTAARSDAGLERVDPPPPLDQPPALLPSKPGPKTLAADPLPPRPPTATGEPATPIGRALWLTAVAVLAVGAILLVYLVTQQGGTGKTPPPASGDTTPRRTAAAGLKAIPIKGGADFDPEGVNGENPDQVHFAFDGNRQTAWTTVRYVQSPKLGGLKPGVGIILDLGSVHSVGKVTVYLGGNGTSLQVRSGGPKASGAAPRSSENAYRVLCTQTGVRSVATCIPRSSVHTRYLLVWLTSLPSIGNGGFQGSVEEVKVLG
jgi:hypothetical protein